MPLIEVVEALDENERELAVIVLVDAMHMADARLTRDEWNDFAPILEQIDYRPDDYRFIAPTDS